MGTGGSREAAYKLEADVPAGTYHCIIDAIIIRSVDVTFELLHRHGGTETTLATWMDHFEPLGGASFDAQAYEKDVESAAIDFTDGDEFVFRYTGMNSLSAEAFIPNGDGASTNGRIPSFTLPK